MHKCESSENIFIELNESGIVAVHAEIGDAEFLNRIAPAIRDLDDVIQAVQQIVNSPVFNRAIRNAAAELEPELNADQKVCRG